MFSFGGYFEVKMILNVCCPGRSSWRFTLSKISYTLKGIENQPFKVLCAEACRKFTEWVQNNHGYKLELNTNFEKSHKDNHTVTVYIWSWWTSRHSFRVQARQRGQPKLPGPGPLLRTSGPLCPVPTPDQGSDHQSWRLRCILQGSGSGVPGIRDKCFTVRD